MPTATTKQFAGLQTSPNPFSKVPDGALVVADECMIRGNGVLESRRGFAPSAQGFAADRCFPLPGTRKAVVTARGSSNPSVYDPDADTITALARSGGTQGLAYPYGSDVRVSMWGAVASSLLYLAGQQGLACVNGTNWRAAGLPRPSVYQAALDNSAVFAPLGFAANQRRTYAVTLAWYDPQGNFYESEPSESFYIENTVPYGGSGGASAVYLQLTYPPMTPVGAFWRIWRALETATGVTASAEMYLVREYIDTQAIVGADGYAAGSLSFTPAIATPPIYDISADSLLNVPLYTNPQTGGGFGILSGNVRPPAATVVATFKQKAYFGRPTFQQQIVLQIIGTGTGGMVLGDSLTIAGVTFTAGINSNPTPNIGSPGAGSISASGGVFAILTNLGAAQNIELTARSLCSTINAWSALYGRASGAPYQRQFTAYYASGGVNDFGRIVIQRSAPTPLVDDPGAAFSVVTASSGVRFPNGSITSADSYSPGGLSWSKPNQPEAVPAVNFVNVGDPQKALLGFSVHSDSMIIYKEDGTFILYDQGGPQPIIQVLDPSVVVTAPQGIAVLNGVALVPTARGALQVTEQGTVSICEPLRTDLQRLQMQNIDFDARSFGVSYESERLYILGVPSSASENGCSYQYVYNVLNGTWDRWLIRGASSGMVLPVQNKLLFTYAAPLPDNNIVVGLQTQGVHVERKGGVVSTDYVDLVGSLPAATYASLTVAAVAGGVPPAVTARATLTYAQDVHLQIFEGDLLLFQYVDGVDTKNHAQWARVTGVNKAVVSIDTASLVTADATVLMTKVPTYYRGIQCRARLTPITLGEPTYEKQWEHTQYYFDYFDGDWLDVTLDSEKQQVRPFSQVAADPQIVNTSGTMGATQWLRSTKGVVLRVDPGQSESRAARLGVELAFNQARANFRLLAVAAHAPEWKEKSTR